MQEKKKMRKVNSMKRKMFLWFFPVVCISFFSMYSASAQFEWFFKKTKPLRDTKLSDTQIVSGLKEALKVGIENTVKSTGKIDGYFGNEAIKILMPENLKMIDKTLRVAGFGEKLDAFVLSMNRAAEQAAPFAEDIFINAIFDMTFDDARKILEGADTAITDYFKEKTYHNLVKAYQPVVEKKMDENDSTRKYKEIVERYQSIPFASKLGVFDPDQYVITKALDGLFCVLGEEERKIRKDPAARVTDLLKEVFK